MEEIIISRACPPDCLEKARIEERKRLGEWLEKHCKGYHRGNHGGQFGHFGIFRDDIEAIKRGEEVK